MDIIQSNREFMKSQFGKVGRAVSDQARGLPYPPLQKALDNAAQRIKLPKPDSAVLNCNELDACLRKRRSRRNFSKDALAQAELAYLLWATQGVQEVVDDGYCTLRPAPSAGARHPFETYLAVNRVERLKPGVYRYLPLTHELVLEFAEHNTAAKLTEACLGQSFVGTAPVAFIWTCIPYRCEWRYVTLAHKVMLIDAGHLCQNLYLAAEAMGCGTCGIGAYDQEAMDALIHVDGEDEYVVYLAPVGKLA
ncbi:MAG TPA: SagB/ThcOx family dehydrogenase [Candidatus Hydrogenedentes bacterium]|nr:SagB/ThcOx family dehydrogenase [Candidatus Hydrogenedentota bacterium]HIJ73225.1 SagB/ThcOx family dehydrogenase [Candidatus Hydrogenedentota bacterium]